MKTYGLIKINLDLNSENGEDIDSKIKECLKNVLSHHPDSYVEKHHEEYIYNYCDTVTRQCLEIAKTTQWQNYVESFFNARVIGEFSFDLYVKITNSDL